MRIVAWVATALSVLIVALASVGSASAAGVYTVAQHDTLYGIARHFGVSVAALAQANNLSNVSRIRVGQVLVIPAPGAPRALVFEPGAPPSQGTTAPDPIVARAPWVVQPAAAAHVYVVQAGDTLYHVARTHGLTVAALQDANGLGGSTTLRVGQALVIPTAAVPVVSASDDAQVSRPFGPPPAQPVTPGAGADAPVTFGAPDGAPEGPPVIRGTLQSALVARRVTGEALQYLGTPYAWGGTTRGGVDCSGLVYAIYSPYVPELPRISYDQWGMGMPVEMTALAPGDLVFFNTDGTGASHVGIYIGDGRFVHPSSSAGRVVIDTLDEPYFLAHYLGARRIL